MEKQQAEAIRSARKAGCTWREIAELYGEKDQVSGMRICEDAAVSLDENPDDKPWK